MANAQAALKSRVQAFDWLRGLAVVFMIQCHALGLLTPDLQVSPVARFLRRLDGLVAPAFIFSAGFSLALVQVRGAATGPRWVRALKTLRRLLEVFLVAELVNWAWFPVWSEPHWLMRIDILHCIAISLVLALPLMSLLARQPKVLRWVALSAAAAVFFVSPYMESGWGALDWLLDSTPNACGKDCSATFPLFPWAGYVYLGASAGATAASGDLRTLLRWLGGIGLVSAALWTFSDQVKGLYPPHNYWVTDPANAGWRMTLVIAVLLGLLALEYRVPKAAGSAPLRLFNVYGTSSMASYFWHEMLLFFRMPLAYLIPWGFSITGTWGNKCGWAGYWALVLVLWSATFGLAWLTDRIYKRLDAKLPSLPVPQRLPPGT